MQGRFRRAFVAGILAGVVADGLNYVLHFFNLTTQLYRNYVAMLVFGRVTPQLGEIIFSQVCQVFFTGVLGVAFAYFLKFAGQDDKRLRGAVYGGTWWFLLLMGSRVFNLAPEPSLPLQTAVALTGTSVLYGYLVAVLLKRLEPEVAAAR